MYTHVHLFIDVYYPAYNHNFFSTGATIWNALLDQLNQLPSINGLRMQIKQVEQVEQSFYVKYVCKFDEITVFN